MNVYYHTRDAGVFQEIILLWHGTMKAEKREKDSQRTKQEVEGKSGKLVMVLCLFSFDWSHVRCTPYAGRSRVRGGEGRSNSLAWRRSHALQESPLVLEFLRLPR